MPGVGEKCMLPVSVCVCLTKSWLEGDESGRRGVEAKRDRLLFALPTQPGTTPHTHSVHASIQWMEASSSLQELFAPAKTAGKAGSALYKYRYGYQYRYIVGSVLNT